MGKWDVLICAGLVVMCTGSGIPPFEVLLEDNDGQLKSELLIFNESMNIVQEMRRYSEEYSLSPEMKLKLFEAVISHAASSSQHRDVEGELFFHCKSKDTATSKAALVASVLEDFDEKDYPLRVWTTGTNPPFNVILGNDSDDYMTHFTMNPFNANGGTWLYDRTRELIRRFKIVTRQPHGVVVDIGANIGAMSLYAAALGENVVAFEATSETSLKLKASCVLNGWCKKEDNLQKESSFRNNERFAIFENAVWDRDGENVTMYLNWQYWAGFVNSGSNTAFSVSEEDTIPHTVEIKETITLDSALAKLGLIPETESEVQSFEPKHIISILKLDCEGCEPKALLGGKKMFKYNPPYAIIVEINTARLRAAGSTPYDLILYIDKAGYDVINLKYGTAVSPVTEESVLAALEDGDIDCICLLRYNRDSQTMA